MAHVTEADSAINISLGILYNKCMKNCLLIYSIVILYVLYLILHYFRKCSNTAHEPDISSSSNSEQQVLLLESKRSESSLNFFVIIILHLQMASSRELLSWHIILSPVKLCDSENAINLNRCL